MFVIDLWSASGAAPDTMPAVNWRAKEILYASNTPVHVASLASKVKLREARRLLGHLGDGHPRLRLDIVHIVYHPGDDQIPSSDAEFSRASIASRRAAGLADMRLALRERPWHAPQQPEHLGCLVHRVTRAEVTTLAGS